MEIFVNFDAVLITEFYNIRYMTGFVGVDPTDREAYCLFTQKGTYLFTNGLYMEQANKLKAELRILNTELRVIEISREKPISFALRQLCDELGVKRLGFEDANISVAEFTKLKQVLPDIMFVPSRDVIEKLRRHKNTEEIAAIQKACDITDKCFDFIIKKLKPGVIESEIAWEIETFLRINGATNAFSPIVAFGANASMPHYDPYIRSDLSKSPTLLQDNDLVLLDFGARYNGYCADMTRVVFVGTPKKEWKYAYETVLAAQEKALDLLKNGERSGATLDAAAKEIIAEAGLPPYPHSLGHNVGLAIHEGPRLSDKSDETLYPGMIFSIEPGVYIEGSYGIRIEDLVRLTDTGVELLSHATRELTIL